MNIATKLATAAVAAISIGAVGVALAGPATAATSTTPMQSSSAVHHPVHMAASAHQLHGTKSVQGLKLKTGQHAVHKKADRVREDEDLHGKADKGHRRADKEHRRGDKDHRRTGKDRRPERSRDHHRSPDTMGSHVGKR